MIVINEQVIHYQRWKVAKLKLKLNKSMLCSSLTTVFFPNFWLQQSILKSRIITFASILKSDFDFIFFVNDNQLFLKAWMANQDLQPTEISQHNNICIISRKTLRIANEFNVIGWEQGYKNLLSLCQRRISGLRTRSDLLELSISIPPPKNALLHSIPFVLAKLGQVWPLNSSQLPFASLAKERSEFKENLLEVNRQPRDTSPDWSKIRADCIFSRPFLAEHGLWCSPRLHSKSNFTALSLH